MDDSRNRLKAALVINVLLVLLELNILSYRVCTSGVLILASRFQYYAHYSNVLILLSSIGLITGLVSQLRGKREHIWYPVRLLRYMAVSSAVLTMVVVILFILPLEGFSHVSTILFGGSHFYEYLACPLLAYLSFVMLGDVSDYGKREMIIASCPAFIYSVVMLVLNALGVVSGPYVFLRVREQSAGMTIFWFIVGNALSYVVSAVLLTVAHMESRNSSGKNGSSSAEAEKFSKN